MNPATGEDSGTERTVRVRRILRAPPERVYRAFLEPAAMVKWWPPHGFTGTVHEIDARVGGGYRMSFQNFATGTEHAFTGTYTELTPHKRIRYTDKFDAPGPQGAMSVSVDLTAVTCGTEIVIAQRGLPKEIPLDYCTLGWQESLTLLAHLVEPEVPDG